MNPARPKRQQFLLATGLGGLAFCSVFLVLGALAPHYDSARDTISALEFTPLGWLQRANFILFGAMLVAFARAIRYELGGGRFSGLIPTFQALSGIGVIGAGVFVAEPLHLLCDLVAFNSALLVLFFSAARLHHDPRWKGWTAYSLATGVVMMGLLTAFGLALHFGGPAGTFEKLASFSRTVWSVMLVRRLYAGMTLAPLTSAPAVRLPKSNAG